MPCVTVDDDAQVLARLTALASTYGLPPAAPSQLDELLRLVQESPHSLTAVRDPVAGVDLHVADSLAGLGVDELRHAQRIADLGAGAGFPGLVLAIALPATQVVLVESVGKKATFLEETIERLGLENAEVVAGRAEGWTAGLGTCDVVVARALASLDILVEYAAPLLREDGILVAWKGRRDQAEEAGAARAAEILGMDVPEAREVDGPAGAERHLYLSRKLRPTPPGYPRREGMARKRPLGASGRG
jgi:16S rRNA (guanine527-N7)-methyltransferase